MGHSLAEGTLVESPARGAEILGLLDGDKDQLVSLSEAEIGEAHRSLIRAGCYVEATSAMVLASTRRVDDVPGKSVLILSGSGLKSID